MYGMRDGSNVIFFERPSRYFGGVLNLMLMEHTDDAVCGPKRLEGEGSDRDNGLRVIVGMCKQGDKWD